VRLCARQDTQGGKLQSSDADAWLFPVGARLCEGRTVHQVPMASLQPRFTTREHASKSNRLLFVAYVVVLNSYVPNKGPSGPARSSEQARGNTSMSLRTSLILCAPRTCTDRGTDGTAGHSSSSNLRWAWRLWSPAQRGRSFEIQLALLTVLQGSPPPVTRLHFCPIWRRTYSHTFALQTGKYRALPMRRVFVDRVASTVIEFGGREIYREIGREIERGDRKRDYSSRMSPLPRDQATTPRHYCVRAAGRWTGSQGISVLPNERKPSDHCICS